MNSCIKLTFQCDKILPCVKNLFEMHKNSSNILLSQVIFSFFKSFQFTLNQKLRDL